MIRSTFISALAVAAMAAVPAFAATTMNSTASENPGAKVTRNTATANTELLPCRSIEASTVSHAQAKTGKLAKKTTAKAKQDCLPESSAKTTAGTTSAANINKPAVTASSVPPTASPSIVDKSQVNSSTKTD